MSGDCKSEEEEHVIRSVLLRGIRLSQRNCSGEIVPTLSLGDHPLFDLGCNKMQNTSHVRPLGCLVIQRKGWCYSCCDWPNQANHLVEVTMVRCKARYKCDVLGKGSLTVDAVLARESALSVAECLLQPLTQVMYVGLSNWVTFLRAVVKKLTGLAVAVTENIWSGAWQSDSRQIEPV